MGMTRYQKYSDDFNRADEDPLSGYSALAEQPMKIVSNKARRSGTTYANAHAYPDSDLVADDHYSEVYAGTGTFEIPGCLVRASGTGLTSKSYMARIYRDGNVGSIFKIVYQTYTKIGSDFVGVSASAGVFSFEVVGTGLEVFDGTSSIRTATDSTHTTGVPGIYVFSLAGVEPVIDYWTGGDNVAAATGHPTAKRWGGVPFMAINRGIW